MAAGNTVKVGMVLSPNYFIKDKEATIGLDHEILQAFAKANNLSITYKVYPSLSSLAKAFTNNEIDIAGGNLNSQFKFLDASYQTAPYLTEDLTIVAYKPHVTSTVNYPTSASVYQAAGADYTSLVKLKIVATGNNIFGLYKIVAKGETIQNKKVRFIISPQYKAKALQQLYPTTVLFKVKDQAGKVVKVNDVFYVRDSQLRTQLSNFLTSFTKTSEFQNIKYNNLNALSIYHREESRIFVNNMQTKFTRYNSLFQQYSTEMDWRLVMAVGYQESRWTPNAVSPWGPSGFMMLTNATAKTLGVTDKLDATQSITEGTKLLMKFRSNLTKELTGYDRDMFAISNYNQGIAKIIDARTWLRQNNKDQNSWVVLAQNYPAMSNAKHKYGRINGNLAAEYIINIRKWYYMIVNYVHFYRY